MKILLCSSSFAGGGITSYAHELINCYSEGNEFSVMVGNDDQNPITKEGVKVYKYDCSDLSYDNICSIVHVINDIIQPDVLISSCAQALSLALPYLSNNIKVITISHSLKYIEADMAAFNNKYTDVVIALSDFNKKYLDKTFGITDNQKVQVVYNFVKEHPQAQLLLENKKNRKSVTIVFPGGVAASKTPEIVVKTLNRLIDTNLDFKFYWLGSTTFHLIKYFPFFTRKDIRNLIKKDDRVVFTGKIPRKDAEDIIANADVFLSPSRREGCPMSLIEAMRVGSIPIVSDYNNANKEIIKNNINGFVIGRHNISKFVDIIKNIITNKIQFSSIYDKSVETYFNELHFNVWKKKMDKILLSSHSLNINRNQLLNKKEYNKNYRKYKKLQKKNSLLFLIQEPLPLLFKFQTYKKYNDDNKKKKS